MYAGRCIEMAHLLAPKLNALAPPSSLPAATTAASATASTASLAKLGSQSRPNAPALAPGIDPVCMSASNISSCSISAVTDGPCARAQRARAPQLPDPRRTHQRSGDTRPPRSDNIALPLQVTDVAQYEAYLRQHQENIEMARRKTAELASKAQVPFAAALR